MKKTIDCILLIDDDPEDNFIHKRVIKKSGKVDKIMVASNGLEGLEYLKGEGKFKKDAENPRPNIIFLDINMPKMNGFEFLEIYKELDEKQKADVCIIMLTTSRNPDDLERANQIPEISSFSTKPLTKAKLDEVVRQYEDLIRSRQMEV